jgi:YHS domain-containing protein
VETQTVFAERNEVCAILTLVVDHKVERFPMVEWYRFEGDRIASIQTIFDTGPFVRRSTHDANTAVDPVCHMSANKNAPAATREHDGRTYYFCSEGCAIAFHEDPHRYLAED